MEHTDAAHDNGLHQSAEILCATERNKATADGQAALAHRVSDAEFKRYLQEVLKENHRLLAKLAE